eukprot:TRINITY_DN13012_c0_g1_i1.p1 TRINITY_DN13012_c0_g1~~TRINITY_DN13012_c0_g1_i1.p1  ORF type:complete len:434 (+),score=55.19 TRINITY_DN13012_c0_g1_i1:69-1370(+)
MVNSTHGNTKKIDVRVSSDNGFGEVVVPVVVGGTMNDVINAYAAEKGISADSLQVRLKSTGKLVKKDREINKAIRGGLRAKVHGLPALRCLFDLYDNRTRAPGPNVRPEAGTKVKKIVIGNVLIDVWNPSPYPRFIVPLLTNGVLFICDICLRYSPVKSWMEEHQKSYGGCAQGVSPPGEQVFLSGSKDISVWRVDGGVSYDTLLENNGLPSDRLGDLHSLRKNNSQEIFCQNVALLARFFLKGKTAFYGTGAFLYYALTELVDGAWRFRGYYSVEKGTTNHNSLACIMVLPPWQDRGYGRLLIHLSYELCRPADGSMSEKSPERPLSELGMCTFLSYWKGAVLDALSGMVASGDWNAPSDRKGKEIDHIVRQTVVKKRDVLKALHALNLLAKPGNLSAPEILWDAARNVAPVARHELQHFEGCVFNQQRWQG